MDVGVIEITVAEIVQEVLHENRDTNAPTRLQTMRMISPRINLRLLNNISVPLRITQGLAFLQRHKFYADTLKFLAELEQIVIKQQVKNYTFQTSLCPYFSKD